MHTRFSSSTDIQRGDGQGWWYFTWSLTVVLALALGTSPRAHAKTFACPPSDVDCLIDAINTANANGETNTIRLAGGTYTLMAINNGTGDDANGLPVITSPLTIQGAGAATTIIERDINAGFFRLLRVVVPGTLILNRLMLRGGALFGGGRGGGLYNSGTVTLTNCTVADNRTVSFARGGGGIANDGTMTLTNCTLADNLVTDSSGGGISNGGTMTLTNCTLVDNTSDVGDGGGGIANGGTMTLTNCTLARNTAFSSFGRGGGGIANSGTMTLTNCTLSDNTGDHGGGIFNLFGTLTVQKSTFSANSAGCYGGGIANDGGLLNFGTLTVQNSTFSANSAGCDGGGIFNRNFTEGAVTLTHVSFENNTPNDCTWCPLTATPGVAARQ